MRRLFRVPVASVERIYHCSARRTAKVFSKPVRITGGTPRLRFANIDRADKRTCSNATVSPNKFISNEFIMGKSCPWWVKESGETDADTKIRAEYNYQLRRLYSKNLFLRVKLGLRNIRAMDRVLGMPHRSYDVVHIAGTNGKGSVALKVAQACRVGSNKANSRPLITGLFTSPHVASFRERVRVYGKPWTMQEATACLQAAEAAAERAGVPATFFELVTMAALLAFKRAGCDVVVLECGLGGRLDATSVVRNTAVASVVSVGLDHVAVLGPTLSDVAREKAGIFRKNAPDAVHVLGAKDGDTVDATAAYPAQGTGSRSEAHEAEVGTALPDSDGGVRAAVIGPGSCSGLLQQLAMDAGVERIRLVRAGGDADSSSDSLEAASPGQRGSSRADDAMEGVDTEYAPEDYDKINSEVARAIVEELGEVTGHKLPAGKELDRALEARPAGRFEVLNLHVDQAELLASNADDATPGRGLHGDSASEPASVQVIMDSAHNPVASRSLVKLLMARFPDTFPGPAQPVNGENAFEVSERPTATPRRLVLGLSSDRSPEDMLRAWKGVVHQDELVCCEADSTRAASAESIAASARKVLGRRYSSSAGAGPVAIPRQASPESTNQGDKEEADRYMQAREEHLKRLREARQAAGPGRARGRHEWEGAEPLPASDPKRVAAGLSTDGIGARYRAEPRPGAGAGIDQGNDIVQEWEEAGRRIGGSRGASGLVRAAGSSVASAVDDAIRSAVAESAFYAEQYGMPYRPPLVVIAGSVYLLAEARGALLRRALEARPWESYYKKNVAEALLGEVEPDDVVK